MKRRLFLKLSASTLIPFWGYGCKNSGSQKFEIIVKSDMSFGHELFEGKNFKKGKSYETDTIIVGGGIAGMASASTIREEDFILCELSDTLGGTSSALQIGESLYAQGAHYDLAYPDTYGSDGLSLLKDLNIIQWNTFQKLWEFREKNYVINPKNESRCFAHGEYRESVLPDGESKRSFIELLRNYRGKMLMPSRIIHPSLHHLNEVSLIDFLASKIKIDNLFKEGLDYNMRDDYGGGSDQVSALAGIHYYECRPYYSKPVELFSPPQGNYYFIQKMANTIQSEKIWVNQLVYQINEKENGFAVKVLDRHKKEINEISSNKIIYAGNKHALKYIYPNDESLFENNQYAPWVIMNIVLKNSFTNQELFWQNELVTNHPSLIGFVDSDSQYNQGNDLRILTAYFCLDSENRSELADIALNKENFTLPVMDHLSEYFGFNILPHIEKVYIKVLGHAMPIPIKNYLFNDRNKDRKNENLVYAGVDNARLPLLFEALDSGIQAVKILKN